MIPKSTSEEWELDTLVFRPDIIQELGVQKFIKKERTTTTTTTIKRIGRPPKNSKLTVAKVSPGIKTPKIKISRTKMVNSRSFLKQALFVRPLIETPTFKLRLTKDEYLTDVSDNETCSTRSGSVRGDTLRNFSDYDSDSSDEDTSDESYETRHLQKTEEERKSLLKALRKCSCPDCNIFMEDLQHKYPVIFATEKSI